ncbi:hypothetical protein ACT4ML_01950 [Natrinema sp. LN54]|uniref:hypothetical protein n=1 Tax=Natrinema sp. LN54 TaxID=3458705 RepID=UPI004035BEA0
MPVSRRRFALASVGGLLGTAGCAEFVDSDRLRTLHLALSNETAEPRSFHFVLEADDGLGQWHEFELEADAHRTVAIEPESEREWRGYHAVTGDERASGTLLGQGDEQSCLQLSVRITDAEIAATMSTARPLCDAESA